MEFGNRLNGHENRCQRLGIMCRVDCIERMWPQWVVIGSLRIFKQRNVQQEIEACIWYCSPYRGE